MFNVTNINKKKYSSDPDDDDDCTVFQTDEDRKILEHEILNYDDDTTEDMNAAAEQPEKSFFRPYW